MSLKIEKKFKKRYNTQILLYNMKNKVFFSLLSLALFFGGISLSSAAAGVQPVFDGGGADEGIKTIGENLSGTGIIESDDIVAVTMGWVQFALTLLGVIAFVAFIWAGGLYITAFANEENAESAKKVMMWTGIGLIVILISYAVVATVIRATI